MRFLLIGNMNAISYQPVWKMIAADRLWLGASSHIPVFRIPDDAPAAGGQYEEDGVRYQKLGNIFWFTNLDHARRHEPLELTEVHEAVKYQRYDNYDAIEVPRTALIPANYDGVMGVPISFLDKYSPDQFEIVGTAQTWDDDAGVKVRWYPTQVQISRNGTRSEVSKLNDGPAIKVDTPPDDATYYEVEGETLVKLYARIFIRRRRCTRRDSDD